MIPYFFFPDFQVAKLTLKSRLAHVASLSMKIIHSHEALTKQTFAEVDDDSLTPHAFVAPCSTLMSAKGSAFQIIGFFVVQKTNVVARFDIETTKIWATTWK